MTTPAKPASMRVAMPETADFVDRKRAEWGRAYVDDCLKRALAGEPGYFYAIEGGHVMGTPWGMPAGGIGRDLCMARWQALALMIGATFAVFMREPSASAAAGGGDGKA
ncbi:MULTISPECIES: hypothetical protein [unclassified Acidovorax]|uniref:hypothetical protein n=1 Tax=unclassified Acidovorax TaxID=2684926 RepID=UPI001C48B58B|nr:MULTISPECIES: hypothetical protein [unclassified Acidovorax]MBV7427291.1 hypothetical protein [Acidovorax sp. sif0732]MBV7448415.1 hypothetical protein [Acidovorax sp. sif0715]